MKKILSLIIALSLTVTMASAAGTSPSQFTDVPSTHWAASYIDEVVKGGLMSGYGDGRFGPDDTLNVDQMAMMICKAKGYDAQPQNGYWAYGAVDYCTNTLDCLSWYDNVISAERDSVPCPRELAYYMLVRGLGVKNGTVDTGLGRESIPDYEDIHRSNRAYIVAAYRRGLTTGIDSDHTFDPTGTLTRAQAAAMFVRAGWATASCAKFVEPGTNIVDTEIYTVRYEGATIEPHDNHEDRICFKFSFETHDLPYNKGMYIGQPRRYLDGYMPMYAAAAIVLTPDEEKGEYSASIMTMAWEFPDKFPQAEIDGDTKYVPFVGTVRLNERYVVIDNGYIEIPEFWVKCPEF